MKITNKYYALLASQRSGSSLLCNLLSQTGVAGTPNEHFSHWKGRSYQNYDISNYEAYLEQLIRETQTSNAVFGVKTMSNDFALVCSKLETFPDYAGHSNTEKVRILFPNIKFIYLTRRHKVKQAISWWKLAQNAHAHVTDNNPMPKTDLRYNFDAISQLLKEITMEECAQQEFLSMMAVVPLTIVYEDYIQDMKGTVQNILDFLGIEDDYSYHESQLYKMADSLTDEWTQRYREELQADWENKRW